MHKKKKKKKKKFNIYFIFVKKRNFLFIKGIILPYSEWHEFIKSYGKKLKSFYLKPQIFFNSLVFVETNIVVNLTTL